MHSRQQKFSSARAVCAVSVLATASPGACSSSSSHTGNDGGGTGSSSGSDSGACNVTACTSYARGGCGMTTDAAIDAAVSSCAMPGGATVGPADNHCATAADDGGARTQAVSGGSCCEGADAGSGDSGDQACPYGATMYGMEGDDDDCKYHVTWTSTPVCEGALGSQFVVTAVYRSRLSTAGTPLPLTGANPYAETFTASPGDWDAATYCDTNSTHPGPTSGNSFVEGPPGTYTGNVVFDRAGQWTVRFHFNAECADLAPDSPHGHAAFHIDVP